MCKYELSLKKSQNDTLMSYCHITAVSNVMCAIVLTFPKEYYREGNLLEILFLDNRLTYIIEEADFFTIGTKTDLILSIFRGTTIFFFSKETLFSTLWAEISIRIYIC